MHCLYQALVLSINAEMLTSKSARKDVRSPGETFFRRYLALIEASRRAKAGASSSLMPKYCIAPAHHGVSCLRLTAAYQYHTVSFCHVRFGANACSRILMPKHCIVPAHHVCDQQLHSMCCLVVILSAFARVDARRSCQDSALCLHTMLVTACRFSACHALSFPSTAVVT